jgi:hypothetical protein
MDGKDSRTVHASYVLATGRYSLVCGGEYVTADLEPVTRGGSGGRHRPFTLELVTCSVCIRELTWPYQVPGLEAE